MAHINIPTELSGLRRYWSQVFQYELKCLPFTLANAIVPIVDQILKAKKKKSLSFGRLEFQSILKIHLSRECRQELIHDNLFSTVNLGGHLQYSLARRFSLTPGLGSCFTSPQSERTKQTKKPSCVFFSDLQFLKASQISKEQGSTVQVPAASHCVFNHQWLVVLSAPDSPNRNHIHNTQPTLLESDSSLCSLIVSWPINSTPDPISRSF